MTILSRVAIQRKPALVVPQSNVWPAFQDVLEEVLNVSGNGFISMFCGRNNFITRCQLIVDGVMVFDGGGNFNLISDESTHGGPVVPIPFNQGFVVNLETNAASGSIAYAYGLY